MRDRERENTERERHKETESDRIRRISNANNLKSRVSSSAT